MVSHRILGKFFIIGMLVFLLLNTSSVVGTYQYNSQGNDRQEPEPTIYGIMGQLHWFISDVTIIFSYEPGSTTEIGYYLDNEWHIYTGPIVITKDGIYDMEWYWKDRQGKTHQGIPNLSFKIDKTPPVIELSKKSDGKNALKFTADANDPTSIVERVEFYLDDVLISTDFAAPYEYTWTGEETHVVYAIGYNYAGLSAQSNNLTTAPRSHFRNLTLIDIIFLLMQKTFFRFYNI